MATLFSRFIPAKVFNVALTHKRQISYRIIAEVLESHGFEAVRQKGSHVQFLKDQNRITVPDHGKKDIAKGTLSSIMRQAEEAGVDRSEFKNKIGSGKGR